MTAILLVIALRLVVPLSIFRWPLAGGIASMIVDAIDVVLVDGLAGLLGEPRGFGDEYAQIDKWLDTYYLAIEAYVVRGWPETLMRRTTLLLFAWRVVGVVLFELTTVRALLVFFPNLFENVYLYVLIVRRWFPRLMPRTIPQLLLVLVLLYIPKAIQEYVLHWEELHPWQWLRETILRPFTGG
jgi:hypothetical protein